MANYQKAILSNQYHFTYLCYDELFPEDSPIAQLWGIIRKLDFNEFDANYKNDSYKGGRPAIPVDRMTAVIVYSLLYGNISMRHLERDLQVRADLLYLSGGINIDHTSISKFRKRNAKALENLFSQTVFLGVEAGMIDFEIICIDSTKIKASANRNDIGTKEEFEKRYAYVKESCRKRMEEWQSCEDEEDKERLSKKIKRLKNQEKRIKAGLAFLNANKDKKRIYLTDHDADWQKNDKGFIVGYQAQAAVDVKSGMITAVKVNTEQNDSHQAQPMIESVEKIKSDVSKINDSDIKEDTKYALDCGYASEENLEKLEDYDLYMPDKQTVRKFGGKTKPEDRKATSPDIEFKYDKDRDIFTCPEGKSSTYKMEKKIRNASYIEYRIYGCKSCRLISNCLRGKSKCKSIMIKFSDFPDLEKLITQSIVSRMPRGKLTQAMRVKLEDPKNRYIYSKRFYTSEPAFGIIKSVRNGWQFLRRHQDRVSVEWIERSIAHNLAKLCGFRQVYT